MLNSLNVLNLSSRKILFLKLIPPKSAGNNHLVKGSKDNWIAIHSTEVSDKDVEELEHKKAWQWLEKYFVDMIKDHVKGKNQIKE